MFSLWQKQIGPFMGVSSDATREQEGGRFRIIVYGAHNAYGLIGSEQNGIAVLDNERRAVLLDMECCESSGYYGPSKKQEERLREIVEMPQVEFKRFVNLHSHARYQI